MKKRYWYKFYWGACPVCGREKSYKMRVYGKKPLAWNKRHIQLSDNETYDHCVG